MKLDRKKMLLISFMLFSLFFGAGNLIFPPFLGQNAGSSTVSDETAPNTDASVRRRRPYRVRASFSAASSSRNVRYRLTASSTSI